MKADQAIPQKPARPPIRLSSPSILAAAAVIAVCVIGLGQFVVGAGGAPFSWPGEGLLNGRFVHAFGIANTLAFATPLFLLGAALFGVAALRALDYTAPSWPRIRELRPRIPYLVALGVCAGACLWLIVELFLGEYHPQFRYLFVSSIGFAICVLFFRDLREGRLRPLPLRWPLLLEVGAVACVVGTFIGINIRDLTNWRYSSIGDEGGFFFVARRILEDSHFNWFSARGGVFEDHPVLGTVWHALNLLVFGNDMFGWKMGALTAIAITLPVFYWLLRELLGPRVAVFATIILGASHYLFSYAHTGYNNIFPIFPTTAALACLVAGMKRGSPAFLFLCGVFAGLGFYTFYSARATIFIAGLALLATRDRRVFLQSVAWIAPGFAFTVLPLFGSDRWGVMQATSNQSFLNSNLSIPELLGYNFLRSLFAFNFNPFGQHYTIGALMDGVSVTLAVAGLGLALAGVKRFPYSFLLIWYAVTLTVAGVLSRYDFVSVSRLHYALPPMAAFAGLALDALVSALSSLSRRPWFAYALTGVTIAAIAPTVFILNGRQFFIYSAHHWPTNEETVLLREGMSSTCADAPYRTIMYSENVDAVLDGSFVFFNWENRRPLQLAYEDLPSVYNGYARGGGVGCLLLGDVTSGPARQIKTRLELEGAVVNVVTDLTGLTQVGRVAPARQPANIDPATLAAFWKTDFSRGSGLGGVVEGQEKHFLPSLDAPPATVPPDLLVIAPEQPSVAVRIGGQTRFYGIQFLMWHGVVNDTLGGVPIVVSYDPISDSAQVFDRRFGDQTYTFALTGFLRDGNALLYDLQTESWWQQLTGEAITGGLAGTQLKPVEFHVVAAVLANQLAARTTEPVDTMGPQTKSINYVRNPYLHYDLPDGKPIFTVAQPDDRLKPLQRVAIIQIGSDLVAVPFPDARRQQSFATTITVRGQRAAVFFDASMQSALDARPVFDSRRAGSMAAFEVQSTGAWTADAGARLFRDESGSSWDMLGEALDGPAQGTRLTSAIRGTAFWSAVSALYPGIQIHTLEPQ